MRGQGMTLAIDPALNAPPHDLLGFLSPGGSSSLTLRRVRCPIARNQVLIGMVRVAIKTHLRFVGDEDVEDRLLR